MQNPAAARPRGWAEAGATIASRPLKSAQMIKDSHASAATPKMPNVTLMVGLFVLSVLHDIAFSQLAAPRNSCGHGVRN